MARKPDSVDKVVGQNIRIRRMASRMSQEQLAHNLGITFQQVQKYEKGTNRIGSGRLLRIASILGVELTELFDGASLPTRKGSKQASPLDLVSEPQSFRMMQAFSRIENPDVRRSLLGLAEMMASPR